MFHLLNLTYCLCLFRFFFYVNSLLLHVCDILKLNVIYNLFAHDGYPHRGIYKNDWLGKA